MTVQTPSLAEVATTLEDEATDRSLGAAVVALAWPLLLPGAAVVSLAATGAAVVSLAWPSLPTGAGVVSLAVLEIADSPGLSVLTGLTVLAALSVLAEVSRASSSEPEASTAVHVVRELSVELQSASARSRAMKGPAALEAAETAKQKALPPATNVRSLL